MFKGKLEALEQKRTAVHHAKMNAKSQAEWLFRSLDADGSGSLDRDEFRRACLLSMASRDVIDSVLDHMDADNSGTIDLEEFISGFEFLKSKMHAKQDEVKASGNAATSLFRG